MHHVSGGIGEGENFFAQALENVVVVFDDAKAVGTFDDL